MGRHVKGEKNETEQNIRFGLIAGIILVAIIIVSILASLPSGGVAAIFAPSATPTLTMTPTLTPTLTPTPAPTATPTNTPTATAAPTATPVIVLRDGNYVIDFPTWDYQMGDVSLKLAYETYLTVRKPDIDTTNMKDRWPWIANDENWENDWNYSYYLRAIFQNHFGFGPDMHEFVVFYFTDKWDLGSWCMDIRNDPNKVHPFMELLLDDGSIVSPYADGNQKDLRDFGAFGTSSKIELWSNDTAANKKFGAWQLYAVIRTDRWVRTISVSKWPGGPKFIVYREAEQTKTVIPSITPAK
jgi:hypothetical protein